MKTPKTKPFILVVDGTRQAKLTNPKKLPTKKSWSNSYADILCKNPFKQQRKTAKSLIYHINDKNTHVCPYFLLFARPPSLLVSHTTIFKYTPSQSKNLHTLSDRHEKNTLIKFKNTMSHRHTHSPRVMYFEEFSIELN